MRKRRRTPRQQQKYKDKGQRASDQSKHSTGSVPNRNTPKDDPNALSEIVPFLDSTQLISQKLSNFSYDTWQWQDIKSYTIDRIQKIIIDHNIPPERLTAPRSDITVPAIEAMRYSQLRNEIVFLIASTMDENRADIAHPSFIEIIKQLTVDEVRLLSALPAEENVIPFINLHYVDQIDRIKLAIRFIIPGAVAEVCYKKRAIPRYIDNLLRLKLVEIPSGSKINDNSFYQSLLREPFLAEPSLQPPKHLHKRVEKKLLRLTNFGAAFRTCCIDQKHLPAQMI